MKKYCKLFVVRCFVALILFLSISILCNFSDKNLLFFKNKVLNNNINFAYFNKIYKKYIDKYIPINIEDKVVMSDKLTYSKSEKYLNGVKLNVGIQYNLNTLESGIVVYVGEKEKLGNTVIVQGNDGVDYWYSNIENISINLYDYVEKNIIVGVSKSEYVYLTFVKDGKYLNYEKYI